MTSYFIFRFVHVILLYHLWKITWVDKNKVNYNLKQDRYRYYTSARNYLQYRRQSPNREILLIGRQFCLRFRRLSLHREDRFSSEKNETVMRIIVCIYAPYNCCFHMEIKKKMGTNLRFLIGAPRICRANAWKNNIFSWSGENLHEVFLTMIKIQRNNKNKYYTHGL